MASRKGKWSEIPRFDVRYRHPTLAAIGEDYRVGVAIDEGIGISVIFRSEAIDRQSGSELGSASDRAPR